MTPTHDPVRPFSELRDSGLLWLINRVVFHPRGYALGLVPDGQSNGDNYLGWRLQGDGSEPWRFEGFDEDELFHAAAATLRKREAAP